MKKTSSKNYRNAKSGFSLIELLLVVTLSSGFLALTALWMQQTLKFSRSVKQRQRVHGSITRLAWDLRDSVRQASAIAMDGEAKVLLTMENGQTASFAISSSENPAKLAIEKVLTKAVEGKTITVRESFELKPNSVAKWDSSEMPEWISLTIARGKEGVANEKVDEGNAKTDSDVKLDGVLELNVRTGPRRMSGLSSDDSNVDKSSAEEQQ